MSFNQKEGVYSAVCSILGESHFDERVNLSSEQRASVLDIVTGSLLDESISMTDKARVKHDTEVKMRTYAQGLLTNWINKDKRLNGWIDYKAKNPGSKRGQKIPEVIELRKLLKQQANNPEVCTAIEAKIAEFIEAAKPAEAPVNQDLVPAEFHHLIK